MVSRPLFSSSVVVLEFAVFSWALSQAGAAVASSAMHHGFVLMRVSRVCVAAMARVSAARCVMGATTDAFARQHPSRHDAEKTSDAVFTNQFRLLQCSEVRARPTALRGRAGSGTGLAA